MEAATYAKYWMTFLVFSVLPAPDSPVHRILWSSRSEKIKKALYNYEIYQAYNDVRDAFKRGKTQLKRGYLSFSPGPHYEKCHVKYLLHLRTGSAAGR